MKKYFVECNFSLFNLIYLFFTCRGWIVAYLSVLCVAAFGKIPLKNIFYVNVVCFFCRL